jgi:hypothetical protein
MKPSRKTEDIRAWTLAQAPRTDRQGEDRHGVNGEFPATVQRDTWRPPPASCNQALFFPYREPQLLRGVISSQPHGLHGWSWKFLELANFDFIF